MSSYIVMSDGSKCYSFPHCRKHSLPEMSSNAQLKISKQLSYVLRHNPSRLGLTLQNGWVDLDILVKEYNKGFGTDLSVENFLTVVKNDSKQRYTVRGKKIRAAQGHSIPVELKLKPKTPPAILYHGSSTKTIDQILQSGLKPMSRTHVHLSSNLSTATQVGSRHGEPKIFTVDTEKASQAGVTFYQAENGVWLSTPIAATFLTLLN